MSDYKKLVVWEKAHQLTLGVYQASRNFPKDELYGLTSQMRRSATSISTNIAEGSGRNGKGEFIHFLHIALGSASELEYQLLLTRDLGFLDVPTYGELDVQVVQIKRMLSGLIQKLKTNN
ncbi:MAG: four helix bundle protein [Anaerolineae bacterium]|nr:four helix bundle protein [Anaerolineae bacterium]